MDWRLYMLRPLDVQIMATTYIKPKIFSLLLFLFAHHATPGQMINNFNWTVCASRDCSSDVMTVIVRCQMTNSSLLEGLIDSPENVEKLDLSSNRIQRLPSGSLIRFTNLIYLSLASNGIQIIRGEAFDGLTKLLELNLSDNNITTWDTSGIEKYLPNLRFLNVELNPFWIPDHRIFSLQNLQGIAVLFNYVHSTPYTLRCYLVKTSEAVQNKSKPFDQTLMAMPQNPNITLVKTENPNELLLELMQHKCYAPKLVFRDPSFLDLAGTYGFGFQCEVISGYRGPIQRQLAYITKGWTFYILIVETCWKVIDLVHILTSMVGILSLVSNIAVIITTLRSRFLRESVAHVLVANIAVGDLLMSFYLIILVSTRQSLSKEEFYGFFKLYYCRIVGLFFLTGQFSSSLLSFLMTLERYLAVVYCMRPHIRITMTTCRVAIVMAWCFSISLAVSFMTSKQFSRYTEDMCVPKSNVNRFPVIIVFGGIGIFLYILSIALYGHVYFDFKRTNQKTVQLQRENRLARRIAPIVFTNLFFFILPLMISTGVRDSPYITNRGKNIIYDTMAVTCLGINSFLNPILFSFRNEKFRNEFRKRVLPCNNSIHPTDA